MLEHKLRAAFVLFHGPHQHGPALVDDGSQSKSVSVFSIRKDTECVPTLKAAHAALTEGKIVIVHYFQTE